MHRDGVATSSASVRCHVQIGPPLPKTGLKRRDPRMTSLVYPSGSVRLASSIMVLGILTAIAACPAIIGTTEAVRQGQRQNAREKHRGLKTNLAVACSRATKAGREIDGCEVVLSENKVRENPPNLTSRSSHTPLFSNADDVKPVISQRPIGRISRRSSGRPSFRRLFPTLS
jgi:hypothetical protein